ncbi:hypothetical protein [Apibacter sp. HY039]|uniref:hypothetical protein n=1 Tax=Apibacter sp. HY039 TaxID=2501476 RepID=UPI000FEB6232|nr:hypothetical protein [Apibacter sp. HY039]
MIKNIITNGFIQQLQELYKLGVDLNAKEPIAKEVLRETLIIEPKKDVPYLYEDDPILDLIKNYRVESFDIGRISFYTEDDLIEEEDYIVVGSEGAGDLIAIKKKTKQIVTLDGYFEQLLVCSETSEQFLNNLIEIGKSNLRHYPYKDKYELAKKLSSESKGDLSFYREALGAFEE